MNLREGKGLLGKEKEEASRHEARQGRNFGKERKEDRKG